MTELNEFKKTFSKIKDLRENSHLLLIDIRNKLKIIEDSADTLGATINGKSSGYFSDMSITSFYGSHIINCAGNGGALAINDTNIMNNSKLLRSWGRSSSLFDEV